MTLQFSSPVGLSDCWSIYLLVCLSVRQLLHQSTVNLLQPRLAPTHKIRKPVPQVLKQVVNLSCFNLLLWFFVQIHLKTRKMSENAKKVIHNIQIIWPHFRMDPSGLSSVCAVPCLCREMAPQGLSGTRGRFHKSFCALRPTFMPYAQLFEKLFTGVKVGRRARSWA